MALLGLLPFAHHAAAAEPVPSATPPAQTQAPAAASFPVRLGAYKGYTRLVFDFPELTAYRIEDSAEGTRIIFTTPANPASLPGASPEIGNISSTRLTPDTLAVTLKLAPQTTLKHYRLMRRVVVDALGPSAKPEEKPESKPEPKSAQKEQPAPDTAEKAQAAETSSPPLPELAKEAGVLVDTTPPPEAAAPDVPAEPTTITLATVTPVKLAVFARNNSLWLVLEGSGASAAVPTVTGPDAGILGAPRSVDVQGGRAYLYTLPADNAITVTRKSLMWEIAVGKNLKEPPPSATLSVTHDKTTNTSKLLIDLKDPGDLLRVQDPTVGDTLLVVPTALPAARIETPYSYADVEVLPAETGLVLRPISDSVQTQKLGTFITVTDHNGIAVAQEDQTASETVDTPVSFAPTNSQTLFDFAAWHQGGIENLNEKRRQIEAQIAAAQSPESRQEESLRLALLYFANGFGHETLGILRAMIEDDPEMERNPNIIALRGAASALAGHNDEALRDLSNPAIQNNPEVRLWTGYTAAASEQWRRADQAFPRDASILADYPPVIAIPMMLYMAESALRLGHADTAEQLLSTLDALPEAKSYPHFDAAAGYLRGEAARQAGRPDEVIAKWTEVAAGLDRLYHSKAALALAMLELQEKKITPKEAVEKLDSLRFSWRGDGLEVRILAALGRARIQAGDYLNGLNDLKSAASLADDLHEDSTPLRQEMAETVSLLFSGGADAAPLDPLQAVSIYTQYENLLPEGVEGVPATLAFADQLVRIDLLDRAEDMISKALSNAQDPAQRGDIGLRLASVYLLDNKPDKALEALSTSASPTLDRTAQDRRTLLAARAQSQQGNTDAAIATLAALDSADARRLKADVLWHARRWREAAVAIETLLPSPVPSPLDDDTARLIMNAAVGYKLSGDSAGLASLHRRYASAMATTTMGATFGVVTRDGGSAALSDRDTILRIAGEVDMFKSLLDTFKTAPAPSEAPAPVDATPAKETPPAEKPEEKSATPQQ